VNSLEPEYRELNAAGLLDSAAASRAIALERGTLFSVFDELRVALYVAVAAITGGVGILIKENLDRIGPLTLMLGLALVAAVCYGVAIRTRLQHQTRSLGGDYLLLLGALMLSADLGYAESQFHWLGSYWSWYLPILATFHAIAAYALNSRLVLSVSLTALAAWFGVEGHPQTLFDPDSASADAGIQALICTCVLMIWRTFHVRFPRAPDFEEVLEHFAANIGFWGGLVLLFTPHLRLVGLAAIAVLAALSIARGMVSRKEAFVVYAVGYSALGLGIIEGQIMEATPLLLMFELCTLILAAIVLWMLHQRLREMVE